MLALIVPATWVAVRVVRALLPEPVDNPFADPCVCGHVFDFHDHYSRHSGCAGFECECVRYEPEILAGVGR